MRRGEHSAFDRPSAAAPRCETNQLDNSVSKSEEHTAENAAVQNSYKQAGTHAGSERETPRMPFCCVVQFREVHAERPTYAAEKSLKQCSPVLDDTYVTMPLAFKKVIFKHPPSSPPFRQPPE